MVVFARRVAHFAQVSPETTADGSVKTYHVRGELFFASSNDLVYQFDYVNDPAEVIIDLSQSQIYDSSTVAALDAIEQKYRQHGKHASIVGLNEPSLDWHGRLSGRLGSGE
jgi:SulP family sulfate permease